MKRLPAILCVICLLLSFSGCNQNVGEQNLFSFNKEQYTVVPAMADGDVIYQPISMGDLDYMMNELLEGEKYGLIAACTVVGSSYNNIHSEDPYTCVLSNVYTPIRIDHIYSKGSEIEVSEGDICYLHEDYFYITEQVPELIELYGKNAVYLRGAAPVINGQQYIMYLYDLERPSVAHLGTGTEKLLFPLSCDLYAFPVGTKENAMQVLLEPNAVYWQTWEEVLQAYSS